MLHFTKSYFRVAEVDAAWALGVAGFVILFIVALCFMAKCRLSLFTRCHDPPLQ